MFEKKDDFDEKRKSDARAKLRVNKLKFKKGASARNQKTTGLSDETIKKLASLEQVSVKSILVPIVFAAAVVCLIYIITQTNIAKHINDVNIVCTKQEINANTFISAKNYSRYFTTVSIDKKAVPDNSFNNVSALPKDGVYLQDTLSKNETILEKDINGKYAGIKKYANGYSTTSFEVKGFNNGVSGTIRTGDLIDIYSIVNNKENDEKSYDLKATNVYVDGVYDDDGKKIDAASDNTKAVVFSIRVTDSEIGAINSAIASGDIQLYKVKSYDPSHELPGVKANKAKSDTDTAKDSDGTTDTADDTDASDAKDTKDTKNAASDTDDTDAKDTKDTKDAASDGTESTDNTSNTDSDSGTIAVK